MSTNPKFRLSLKCPACKSSHFSEIEEHAASFVCPSCKETVHRAENAPLFEEIDRRLEIQVKASRSGRTGFPASYGEH